MDEVVVTGYQKNVDDNESINFLKDAAATAIFMRAVTV